MAKIRIYGIDTDEAGRCTHYHKKCDIAALFCTECGKYYACYECHDALEDHPFKAAGSDTEFPVLCGICRRQLTQEEYMTGSCPGCSSEFNPRCKLHYHIYFEDQRES